jgi:Uma2 family endonuclease
MSTLAEPSVERARPDDYEVVNGVVVELPPMSGFASEVAGRILERLNVHTFSAKTGRARSDMLFSVPIPDDSGRKRKPDVAYISFERWPENGPMPYRGDPVDVVPDLAVEVASPTNDAEDLLAKAHEYLRAGVRAVWLVYPKLRQVYVYTSQGGPARVFTEREILDAGDVLPGFSVPMSALFPTMIAAPKDGNGNE